MQIGEKGVKYGLQVRKPPQAGKPAPRPANIFGDDASDDEEDNVEAQIARHAARKQADQKAAELQAAALAQDATVFDYDSHYDAIQETRAAPRRQEKVARQPRYIASLLEKAEERKREQEVQYERQLARERAAEDHLYGEKERFVTSAYRKKMEEEATWAAERKAKEAEEERNAVEKKGHMGDFYRNLLRNNVAFGTVEPGSGGSGGGDKAEPSGALKASGSRPDAAEKREAEGEEDIMPERRAEMAAEAAAAERGTAAERAEPPAPHLRDAGEERARPRSPKRYEEPAERGPAEDADKEPAAVVVAAAEPAPAAGTRRNRDDAVASARERYLARKRKAESMQ